MSWLNTKADSAAIAAADEVEVVAETPTEVVAAVEAALKIAAAETAPLPLCRLNIEIDAGCCCCSHSDDENVAAAETEAEELLLLKHELFC